jgi:hypothetical protein
VTNVGPVSTALTEHGRLGLPPSIIRPVSVRLVIPLPLAGSGTGAATTDTTVVIATHSVEGSLPVNNNAAADGGGHCAREAPVAGLLQLRHLEARTGAATVEWIVRSSSKGSSSSISPSSGGGGAAGGGGEGQWQIDVDGGAGGQLSIAVTAVM